MYLYVFEDAQFIGKINIKKKSKNRTFHITWGSIQEWGCNQADVVVKWV